MDVQLAEREQQLGSVSAKFLQLQRDFAYNLQLLDGRDAELVQYDAEAAGLAADADAKTQLAEQMRAAAAHAQAGARAATMHSDAPTPQSDI